jgi:hypothetical protein
MALTRRDGDGSADWAGSCPTTKPWSPGWPVAASTRFRERDPQAHDTAPYGDSDGPSRHTPSYGTTVISVVHRPTLSSQ